jgi:O-antigen/teichoic acid export membrane protein
MFRSLAKNILISGMAYAVISLIGLFLAPFLIAAYGLAGYGQVLLARLFLPTSTFAFLDFGIGETATRLVATANSDGDWPEAARGLTLLGAIALAASTALGLAVLLVAWRLPDWLSIAPDQRPGFTLVMLATAALQPVLFLSMIFEGALKGFESFRRLRSCEIAAGLFYAALAIGAVAAGLGPNWVAAGLLASLALRFALVAVAASRSLRARRVGPARWSARTRTEIFRWSRLMLYGKSLGTLQSQVAQPLIGLLIGPAAVGAFDAVTRLPRAAKSIFGLMSGTVLPLAAGLKARADAASLKRLGAYGILVGLLAAVPPLVFAMVYSRALLHYWIGEEVTGFWGWQSAMFAVSIMSVAVSFGNSILLADRAAATRMTALSFLQVALQIALSLALVGTLDQWAFVVGHAASAALVFPAQFELIRRTLGLDLRLPLQFAAILAVSSGAALAFHYFAPQPGPVLFVLLACAFGLVVLPALAAVVLRRSERLHLAARLRAQFAARNARDREA